jgi:hypothetical protein
MKTKPFAWAALILVAVLVSGASIVVVNRVDRAAHAWSARARTHLAGPGTNAIVKTIVSVLSCAAKS